MPFFKSHSPVSGRPVGKRVTGNTAHDEMVAARKRGDQAAYDALKVIHLHGQNINIGDTPAIDAEVAAAKERLRALGYDVR